MPGDLLTLPTQLQPTDGAVHPQFSPPRADMRWSGGYKGLINPNSAHHAQTPGRAGGYKGLINPNS
ncbi:MAG: hypothetical protein WBZ40_01735, partial [Acidimicrobiia bacterium]